MWSESPVRGFRAQLRPDGVIKIGVPYGPQLRTKLRAPDWTAPKRSASSLNGVAPLEHLNHFEPASLDTLDARCSLEPLAIDCWDLSRVRLAARPRPDRRHTHAP